MREITIKISDADAQRLAGLQIIDGDKRADINDMTLEQYASHLLSDLLAHELPDVKNSAYFTPQEAEELGAIIAEAVRDQLDAEESARRKLGDAIREAIKEDMTADLPTSEKIRASIRADIEADTKERARRKWEEIKRQWALTTEEITDELVITDIMRDEI